VIETRSAEDRSLLEWAGRADAICPPGLGAVTARGLCKQGLFAEIRYGVFAITDEGRRRLQESDW
jgi:hypothetical protein